MMVEELYLAGTDFRTYLDGASLEDSERTLDYFDKIRPNRELRERILKLDRPVKILILGEAWCPDCMINIPVVYYMNKLNKNLSYSILSREGHEEDFRDYLQEGKLKIPTFIVMDDNFKNLGHVIERPRVLKAVYQEGDQIEIIKASKVYRDGGYLTNLLEELLEIMEKSI